MQNMQVKNFKIQMITLLVLATALIFVLALPNFARLDDCDVFEANIAKVVEVRASDDGESWAYGTGCFVDDNGSVLTNKHMIFNSHAANNFSIIQIRNAYEKEFVDVRVVATSADCDLALLSSDYNSKNYFEVSNKFCVGEKIFTIGNPNGFGLSFAGGNISCNIRNVLYDDKTISAIQTSLVINEGNSGGPVFNGRGELIGLISFRLKNNKGEALQGVSFAVPGENILGFLKNKK